MYGKMLRLRYYRECEKEEDSVYMTRECVYMDLCGPMSGSLRGAKYFMLVKDKNLVTCLCIF